MPVVMDGSVTLVDFALPTREKPISHQGVDTPLCQKCKQLDLSFFDPMCPGCNDILVNPKTTISQIFAILRQWVPQTQQNIQVLIKEILRRGAHINDRDGLTDMTMLHYAAKSGAVGVGDAGSASETVQGLIEMGADFSQKCRWTDMLPLHYATFFDVVPVVNVLLNASGSSDADTPCKEFENGTPLHIASTNLCYRAAKCLLEHKANPNFKNALGKTGRECLPKAPLDDPDSEMYLMLQKLQVLLMDAENASKSTQRESLTAATLHALGLAIEDKVVVSGKVGILKYCGTTDFASGQWAGIALDEEDGKNDGSVGGVRYFHCEPRHGIFAPVSKVQRYSEDKARKHLSEQTSLESTDIEQLNEDDDRYDRYAAKFKPGVRVLVAGQKKGTIRSFGYTKFASGLWVGVELDEPSGKNDGSVAGARYFYCEMNYGIFAPVSKVKRIFTEENGQQTNKNMSNDKENQDSLNRSESTDSGRSSSSPSSDRRAFHSNLNDEYSAAVANKTGTKEKTPSKKGENPRSENEGRGNLNSDKTRSKDTRQPTHNSNLQLKPGMSVYVNNELGIVRFIGRVEFATGIWLGVELRKPSGKNDGSVGDHRYFSCKQNYGLMVRPNRATCRGINCAQLLPAL